MICPSWSECTQHQSQSTPLHTAMQHMAAMLQELGATPELTSLHTHTNHNALPSTLHRST